MVTLKDSGVVAVGVHEYFAEMGQINRFKPECKLHGTSGDTNLHVQRHVKAFPAWDKSFTLEEFGNAMLEAALQGVWKCGIISWLLSSQLVYQRPFPELLQYIGAKQHQAKEYCYKQEKR